MSGPEIEQGTSQLKLLMLHQLSYARRILKINSYNSTFAQHIRKYSIAVHLHQFPKSGNTLQVVIHIALNNITFTHIFRLIQGSFRKIGPASVAGVVNIINRLLRRIKSI